MQGAPPRVAAIALNVADRVAGETWHAEKSFDWRVVPVGRVAGPWPKIERRSRSVRGQKGAAPHCSGIGTPPAAAPERLSRALASGEGIAEFYLSNSRRRFVGPASTFRPGHGASSPPGNLLAPDYPASARRQSSSTCRSPH